MRVANKRKVELRSVHMSTLGLSLSYRPFEKAKTNKEFIARARARILVDLQDIVETEKKALLGLSRKKAKDFDSNRRTIAIGRLNKLDQARDVKNNIIKNKEIVHSFSIYGSAEKVVENVRAKLSSAEVRNKSGGKYKTKKLRPHNRI